MVSSLLSDILASTGFLSRLPVYRLAGYPEGLPELGRTSYAFPLAGWLVALPAMTVLYAAQAFDLSNLISAILAITALVITTGALHEDGLADMADGFWGGQSKQRKLEIMRDSRIGTYGVIALILSLLLRIALLAALLRTTSPIESALAFGAIASLSRFAMLQPWSALPPARSNSGTNTESNGKSGPGLSARYGTPDRRTNIMALPCLLPAIVTIFFIAGLPATLAGLAVFQAAVWINTGLSRHHIGGHTGDTLGAAQQMSELGLLLGLIIII